MADRRYMVWPVLARSIDMGVDSLQHAMDQIPYNMRLKEAIPFQDRGNTIGYVLILEPLR